MTKQTYYAIICPVCGFKTIGNWKQRQYQHYLEHYWIEHLPKPIIKEKRTKIIK